ncbi:MAG: sensor histidine kinase, partial [Sphingobacteriales bacterium]
IKFYYFCTAYLISDILKNHFYKHLPGKFKLSWRDYYTGENLFMVRVACFIFLLLNLVIRLLYLIFPISLTKADNFPEFNMSNWVFIASGIVFLIISNILVEDYRKKKKATAIMALFVFTFSLFIISCGMFSSFIATSDPRNSLTLYLISLTVVGVLCIFEFYETIILLISIELLFTMMLMLSHADATEMLYNQLVSFILLGGFYLISRYFFSSKANYFRQLNEINEKNHEIERGSELKSQLLGMVAHDLRNPIAAIESVAMLMEMDDIEPDTQENLGFIKVSCVKARTIIEDLLETARNENMIEFVTHKTELNKFIIDIVDVWKIQDDTKNIELTSHISPAYAMINHEKFQRVLDNLINNAFKFSKENSLVEIFLDNRGPNTIIEIKDNGIGIPTGKLPIIFDPFTKAGRNGLKGEQSTGLGLSIVKQIVEKHKGKIEVESEEGKGSVFRIELPVWDN